MLPFVTNHDGEGALLGCVTVQSLLYEISYIIRI